jgi:hypothetical protein
MAEIEGSISWEPEDEPHEIGVIRADKSAGLPSHTQEGGETIVIRNSPQGTYGEVFIHPEVRTDLIGSVIPDSAFQPDRLNSYILPNQIFQRKIIDLSGRAGTLILQLSAK